MDPDPRKSETFRLFVALEVPSDVRDAIQQAASDLRRALPNARIAWARPEQFHLTLKFLGNVEPNRLPALSTALRAACSGFAPLQLRAADLGFFPTPRSPRVIWVGVNDRDGRLLALQQRIETAVSEFTAERPESRFQGHLTLGRIKDIRRGETEALATTTAAMHSRVFGEWPAEAVNLMRSELSSQGPRHTLLEAISLAGAP